MEARRGETPAFWWLDAQHESPAPQRGETPKPFRIACHACLTSCRNGISPSIPKRASNAFRDRHGDMAGAAQPPQPGTSRDAPRRAPPRSALPSALPRRQGGIYRRLKNWRGQPPLPVPLTGATVSATSAGQPTYAQHYLAIRLSSSCPSLLLLLLPSYRPRPQSL